MLRDLRRDPDSKTSEKTSNARTQISIDGNTSRLRHTDTETHSSKEIKGVAEIRLREGGLIGKIVGPWLRLVLLRVTLCGIAVLSIVAVLGIIAALSITILHTNPGNKMHSQPRLLN